jgi:hypothetical protein
MTWRRGWDSNPRGSRLRLFESRTIDHSDTSPGARIIAQNAAHGKNPDRALGRGQECQELAIEDIRRLGGDAVAGIGNDDLPSAGDGQQLSLVGRWDGAIVLGSDD